MFANGRGDDSGTLFSGFVNDDFSHDAAVLIIQMADRPFIDELHAGELLGKIYDLFEGIDIFVFQAKVCFACFSFRTYG